MNRRLDQSGVTLVVSLIMLVVVTLLAVYAIRSSNTNLRIAGNAQVQAEAEAATDVAIAQVIEVARLAVAARDATGNLVMTSMSGTTAVTASQTLTTALSNVNLASSVRTTLQANFPTAMSAIPALTIPVTVAGREYTVTTNAFNANACTYEKAEPNVLPANPTPGDLFCANNFTTVDGVITASGTQNLPVSQCKRQNWEVRATVTDNLTGASVTTVEGLLVRTLVTSACP